MADEARETLLEEKEDNNCPGCNIDRVKQEQRGIPYIHLSFIWLVSLCTGSIFSSFSFLYVSFVSTNLCVSLIRMMLKTLWCMSALPISSLFPYLYFMIRDFHVAEKEEDIGFYAGFVGNNFRQFFFFNCFNILILKDSLVLLILVLSIIFHDRKSSDVYSLGETSWSIWSQTYHPHGDFLCVSFNYSSIFK